MKNDSPNAAIGWDERPEVSAAIHFALANGYAEGQLRGTTNLLERACSLKGRLQLIAALLERPGPPLVSAADVSELLELITSLSLMVSGQVLDHQWGYIRRVDDGFMVANPHQSNAEGNWTSDDCVHLAGQMYRDHLFRRGLTPQP